MATDFDRDDQLHGLLRDTLRSQPASGPCIDAATLAAWAEDALTPEETAAVDSHMAACAHCRELAATLSAMPEAEAAPAAVVPFTPRPNGRWKVIVGAMGAVAASALIWVAVRDGSPTLDTRSAANRAEQGRGTGGSVPVPDAAATPPRTNESANALLPRAAVASEAERRQDQQGQQGQRAVTAPRPEATLARKSTAPTAEQRASSAKPSPVPVEPPAVAAPPPPRPAAMPPPPAAPLPTVTAGAGAARSSTVSGLPQSTINIDISGVKNQSDPSRSSETFFAVTTIAEFVVGADLQVAEGQQGRGFGAVADPNRAGGAGRGGGGGGGRGAGGGGAAAGAAGGVAQRNADTFRSTAPIRWRLRGGSPAPPVSMALLERSKDAGVTWESVSLPAQTTMLSGGTAPTDTVCWLVGRAGTVLLSTDGTTFRQVTKPVDADLVSVRATDARSATVRTADGREFTTADGGITWVRKPPTNKP